MSPIAPDINEGMFIPQLFVWTGGSFTLLRTLDFKQRILSVAAFTRGLVPHLLVCVDRQTDSCLLLEWTNGRFESPKPLKLTGRATQAEAINTRAGDTLLLVLVEGNQTTNSLFIAIFVFRAVKCVYHKMNWFGFERDFLLCRNDRFVASMCTCRCRNNKILFSVVLLTGGASWRPDVHEDNANKHSDT